MQDIRWGQPVTFGLKGSARQAAPIALDFTESNASWTTDHFCGLDVRLPLAQREIVARFSLSPYLYRDQVLKQDLWIFMNGLLVGYSSLTSVMEVSFAVPKAVLAARDVQLRFTIPTAAQPKALGVSADERRLGVLLQEVTFATS